MLLCFLHFAANCIIILHKVTLININEQEHNNLKFVFHNLFSKMFKKI